MYTAILSFYSINGYVILPQVYKAKGSNSGWGFFDSNVKSRVSCPSYATSMTSCGMDTTSENHDGSWQSGDECIAQNGANWDNGGVTAVATCVDRDLLTCKYVNGEKSGGGDDDKSTVGCGDSSYLMVGCSAYSNTRDIDGSYIGNFNSRTTINSNHKCVAYNDGGDGVYARGICCKPSNDYELQCFTNWGDGAGDGEWSFSGSCGNSYVTIACGGYSKYANSLATYQYDDSWDDCEAYSKDRTTYAVATCCRLYKPPTQSPTAAPTGTVRDIRS